MCDLFTLIVFIYVVRRFLNHTFQLKGYMHYREEAYRSHFVPFIIASFYKCLALRAPDNAVAWSSIFVSVNILSIEPFLMQLLFGSSRY